MRASKNKKIRIWSMHKGDAARSYQEQKFAGRRELSISMMIVCLLWLADLFIPLELKQDPNFDNIHWLLIPALLLYLNRFWQSYQKQRLRARHVSIGFHGFNRAAHPLYFT